MNLSAEVTKEWGLDSLPDEKKEEMVERIGRFIYQAVLVRALDILSEQEQEEFDKLLDADSTSPQEVVNFLFKKIPTFDVLVKEESNKLKADILSPSRS